MTLMASLIEIFVNQFCDINFKYHCFFVNFKVFNQLDELLFLFKSSKHFPLLICYRNDVFLLCPNYIFIFLYYDCSFFTLLYFFGCSLKSFVSTFSLTIDELSNFYLISSLLSLFVLIALSAPPFSTMDK